MALLLLKNSFLSYAFAEKSLHSHTKIWFVPPSPFTPFLGVQKVSPPLEPYWRYYIFEAFFPSSGKKVAAYECVQNLSPHCPHVTSAHLDNFLGWGQEGNNSFFL